MSAEERVKEIHEAERAAMVAGFQVAADDCQLPWGSTSASPRRPSPSPTATTWGPRRVASARSSWLVRPQEHRRQRELHLLRRGRLHARGQGHRAVAALQRAGDVDPRRRHDEAAGPRPDSVRSDSRAIQDVWIALYDRAQGPVADETRRRHPRGRARTRRPTRARSSTGPSTSRAASSRRARPPTPRSTRRSDTRTTTSRSSPTTPSKRSVTWDRMVGARRGGLPVERRLRPRGHGERRRPRRARRGACGVARELWAKRAYEPDAAGVRSGRSTRAH